MAANRQIGQYRVLDELGDGQSPKSFASALHAVDFGSRRKVALKIIPRDDRGVRIVRNAQVLEGQVHPNVTEIFEVFRTDDNWVVVSEFINKPLSGVMGRLRGSSDVWDLRVVGLGRGIAEGLALANSFGIVHGNLKPSNVLMAPGGSPKLVDFGAPAGAPESRGKGHPYEGVDAASARYLSPEMAVGQEPDARSDVYSLGLLLYEIFAGEPAFSGGVDELLEQQATGTPPDLTDSCPELPVGIESIVRKAIQKDPVDRFQSAVPMSRALSNASVDPHKIPFSSAFESAEAIIREMSNMPGDGP